MSPEGLVAGPDGSRRCAWATRSAEYLAYHDEEWGRPVHGDDLLFERLSLEAFQAGLSWLLVLRRRAELRAAFAGFRMAEVAEFSDPDIERLATDPRIIRNRAKITSVVRNARLGLALPGGLSNYLWGFAPPPAPRPRRPLDVATGSPESMAMARDLRRRGFSFVGPTTAYSLMQAVGMVDDHLAGCCA
ncbi:MAG: DNA-3-methyladenine glycosylase I [Mycobacteriales bacterium]